MIEIDLKELRAEVENMSVDGAHTLPSLRWLFTDHGTAS